MRTRPLSRRPGSSASSWDSGHAKGHARRERSWLDKSFWVELVSRRPWRGGGGRGSSRGIGDGGFSGGQGGRAWGSRGKRAGVQVGEASPLLGTGQFEV